MNDTVSLKTYVDARIDELRLYSDSRFRDAEKAVTRQIEVTEGRLEKLNEVKEQLGEQYNQFNGQLLLYLPRAEYTARHDQLGANVRRVEDGLTKFATLELLDLMKNEIRDLSEWRANMAGRLWTITFGLAALQVLMTLLRAHLGG